MRVKTKSAPLQTVRGMRDILPEDEKYWDHITDVGENLCRNFGYGKIVLPVLEFTSLFEKGTGADTDIVEKEMYSFATSGGDNLTLRPEGTPGAARAYIEHGMINLSQPVKLFYMGQFFRHERPQAGRYREFRQLGVEVFGDSSAILDAETILLAYKIVKNSGINNICIEINSIGCSACRPHFKTMLVRYFRTQEKKLCKDCKRRLTKNPLRIFDCKEVSCIEASADAPQFVDHLCDDCHKHLKSVLEYLDELDLMYTMNPKLVRGLDYYTRTVFEIFAGTAEDKGNALGGGGRYDKLVEMLGGKPTPAVGFALGMDRIVDVLKMQNIQIAPKNLPKVFLVQLGDLARRKSLKLFSELIDNNISVAESFGRGSIKSQFRIADRLRVKIALIIGQKEAIDGTIILRDMESGMQEIIVQDKLVKEIQKRM